jgi:2-succinyl-6-hydroxy-2,4-cyclohexadiene-1-carboxylate synthase
MGTGAMVPVHARLREIRSPTLVVAGALDAKFSRLAETMVAALPNGELLIVAGAGHAVHVEQPLELAARLSRFLDRVEPEVVRGS